jgi:hypothetical protein
MTQINFEETELVHGQPIRFGNDWPEQLDIFKTAMIVAATDAMYEFKQTLTAAGFNVVNDDISEFDEKNYLFFVEGWCMYKNQNLTIETIVPDVIRIVSKDMKSEVRELAAEILKMPPQKIIFDHMKTNLVVDVTNVTPVEYSVSACIPLSFEFDAAEYFNADSWDDVDD